MVYPNILPLKLIHTGIPKKLWNHFADICSIPHPSNHEAKIIEHVKSFGEKLGLETVVDHVGNIVIKKGATKGLEDRQKIVLSGIGTGLWPSDSVCLCLFVGSNHHFVGRGPRYGPFQF